LDHPWKGISVLEPVWEDFARMLRGGLGFRVKVLEYDKFSKGLEVEQ
jgi:hypothetical protein